MKALRMAASATILSFAFLSSQSFAEDRRLENIKPNIAGETYLFDYGSYAYEITIASDEFLKWKLVKGEFDGPEKGSNSYLSSQIADGIIFLSWAEESGMQFYNIMNLNSGVLTTHANAHGLFINMGTVSIRK